MFTPFEPFLANLDDLEKTEFISKLSHAIWKTSKGHFYIGEVTIIIPANWQPPRGQEATDLNFNGTVSYVNFDEIPIRIYPDKVILSGRQN